MTQKWAQVNPANNAVVNFQEQEGEPEYGGPWVVAPADAQVTPPGDGSRAPEPGEWGWNPAAAAVEVIVAPTADEQRPGVLAALQSEMQRSLVEDGVTFTNAAAATARYRLNRSDQQNITATALNGDPSFTGVTKTSLDAGEVALTAQDCHALAVVARARVIQIVDWYKAQKAAVEASADPVSLLPFTAPVET